MLPNLANQMLTPEQRSAGYSIRFEGDKVQLLLNGAVFDTVFANLAILTARGWVQNHIELRKVIGESAN